MDPQEDDDDASLSLLQSLAEEDNSDSDSGTNPEATIPDTSSRTRLAEEIFKEEEAKRTAQHKTQSWTGSVSIRPPISTKQKKQQSSIEEYSGLRIGNRLLSSAEIGRLLSSKKFVRIADLTPRVVGNLERMQAEVKRLRSTEGQGRRAADAQQSSAWITIGVCAKKSRVNLSSKGSKYIIWTITDLSHGKSTSISVFLYQEAMELKVPIGSIVAIGNAKILPSNSGRGSFMLTINQGSQLTVLGKSLDFGFCTYSGKGQNCSNFINKNDCAYCDFHAGVMYKQFKANRMSLNSTSGGALPKKIGRKAQHLSHGAYDLPAWAKGKGKKSGAGAGARGSSKPTLSGVQKIKKSMGVEVDTKPKRSAKLSKNATAIVGKDGKVYSNAKPRKSGKKGPSESADAAKFKKAVTSGIQSNGKYAVACGLSSGGKRCAAALGLDLRVSEKDKREYVANYENGKKCNASKGLAVKKPSIVRGGLREAIANPRKRQRSSTMSKNQILAEALRTRGVKLARTDPNSTRLKDLKLPKSQRSQKRAKLSTKNKENALFNRVPASKSVAKTKFASVSKASAEEIMEAKSIYHAHAEAEQDKVLDDSLGFLEKKESLSDKLAKVTSIKVTAFKCHSCNFCLENILDSCKRAGHRIEKIQAKKRFFKCSNCGFKLDTIGEKMPKSHCHRNERWLKCSAYSDKTLGQKSEGTTALKLAG